MSESDLTTRPYFIIEWSGGGGFGHYAFLLADALKRRGANVVHVTRRGHDLTEAPLAHPIVLAWPAAPPASPGLRRRVTVGAGRLLGWSRACRLVVGRRREKPVVHLQSVDQYPEILFGVLLRAVGATVLLTLHNAVPHDSGRRRRIKQSIALRLPHGVIVHTDAAGREVRRIRGASFPVRQLPHPSYRRLASLAHSDHASKNGPLTVGSFGMIRPYKGLEFVAETFGCLVDDGLDVKLRVAGRTADPSWLTSLLDRFPEGSTSHRLGYLPLAELVREMDEADVILLGHRSLSESGIALLALGAGAVVVGPRLGALERLLGPQQDWLFEPGDVNDATRKVVSVLDVLREDRTALRAAAFALADAAPSWDAMADTALLLLDDTAPATPRSSPS